MKDGVKMLNKTKEHMVTINSQIKEEETIDRSTTTADISINMAHIYDKNDYKK